MTRPFYLQHVLGSLEGLGQYADEGAVLLAHAPYVCFFLLLFLLVPYFLMEETYVQDAADSLGPD
jgi:hypothetical protein